MPAIPFKKFCQLLGVESPQNNFLVTGASVDTRLTHFGNAFFALPGERVDGHNFLEEAAKKKAAVLIISESYKGPLPPVPVVRVKDTLNTLQSCAKAYLKTWSPLIIALTGSSGKTTTKDFLKVLLSKIYKVGGTKASYNGQIGLPLSILNCQGDEELLILEMAMTLPGHICQLINIAEADISLITNVHLAHACSFDHLNQIALAKSEIFLSHYTKVGFMQAEVPTIDELMKIGNCKKICFSIKDPQAAFYLNCSKTPYELYHHGEKKLVLSLPLKGQFNAENFLAAAAVAHYMGLDWSSIAEAAQELKASPNRFEEIQKNGVTFFDDTYNASSPQSVCSALRALPTPEKGGKRIAILSEMVELGKFNRQGHEEVAACALEKVETLLCYGKQCHIIADIWAKHGRKIEVYVNRKELMKAIRETLCPKDVVLVKANRGCAWENLVEEI